MIEHGYSSNKWMMKQIIMSADPRYLKAAVLQVVDDIHERGITNYEILDMLVQISSTGRYEPEDQVAGMAKEALDLANNLFKQYFTVGSETEDLPEDAEELVKKFREALNDVPTADEPNDNKEEGE